ncbi:MAG TPA: VOC family protein [Bryobacteraceae bacterium]|nr:VOC family protein [Bryobacteraceae bacterium]
MSQTVKPIPEGYHSLTASIVVNDAARAIDFYKRAFNAVEMGRFSSPDGKVAHAELKFGDSKLMLSDEFSFGPTRSPATLGGTTTTFYIYTEDVDSLFDQAVKAGATVKFPLKDQFWGDRTGHLTDPFGHVWALAMHKEDVSPEEMQRRGAIEMARMAQQAKGA